jgi:hypothetical protein
MMRLSTSSRPAQGSPGLSAALEGNATKTNIPTSAETPDINVDLWFMDKDEIHGGFASLCGLDNWTERALPLLAT